MIKPRKFTFFPLGKALKKQTKKQFDVLKSLNFSNQIGELKKVEIMFPQNQIS